MPFHGLRSAHTPQSSQIKQRLAYARRSYIGRNAHPGKGGAICDNPMFEHATSSWHLPRRRAARACERQLHVSRTYRDRPERRVTSRREDRRRTPQRRLRGSSDGFRCRHCGLFAEALRFGGRHRNHCPYCLYSLHVDGRAPGDRASDCRSRMAPVGVFARPQGRAGDRPPLPRLRVRATLPGGGRRRHRGRHAAAGGCGPRQQPHREPQADGITRTRHHQAAGEIGERRSISPAVRS